MGQIVRRKKKGRPSKADLARRSAAGESPATAEPEIRRSHRRRNVKYNIDYDDYLDEDDEDEEEDERRREKKLKLVVKLSHEESAGRNQTGPRGEHAPASGSEDEDEDEDGAGERNHKKRRINGGGDDEEEEQDDVVCRGEDDDEEEVRF